MQKARRASLNSHIYQLNAEGQRTKHTRADGSYIDYTYDHIGQLKTALGKESGGSSRLHEQFTYGYDAAGNLNHRTNNALAQTFSVNSRNQLTSVGRAGTLTVAGAASSATSTPACVTVNGNATTLYGDKTFAKSGVSLAGGINTFTAIATDARSRGVWKISAHPSPQRKPQTPYYNQASSRISGKMIESAAVSHTRRSLSHCPRLRLAFSTVALLWRRLRHAGTHPSEFVCVIGAANEKPLLRPGLLVMKWDSSLDIS